MSESSAVWYLAGQGDQPSGPHSSEAIVAGCQTGQLSGATLCWREGMDQWRPLAEVEEFRAAVAQLAPATTDLAVAEESGIGKAFGKLFSATKNKAKAASFWLSIRQREKRKDQLFRELGRLFYESGADMLSQEPYVEKTRQVRAEEEAIEGLRAQIQALEKPVAASPGAGRQE